MLNTVEDIVDEINFEFKTQLIRACSVRLTQEFIEKRLLENPDKDITESLSEMATETEILKSFPSEVDLTKEFPETFNMIEEEIEKILPHMMKKVEDILNG